MSFAQPNLLFLVLLLPLLVGLLVFRYARRRQRVAQTLGDPGLLARLGGESLTRFPGIRLLLLLLAAATLGVAAAGPRWGMRSVENQTRTRSIVLALDISKSMLARDVQPNRLERERLMARRILRDLAADRIGLVVFAGRAYILSPLTTDHGALQLYVDALDPEMVSQGGSSLAAAITQAADLARGPDGRARGAAVVVLSDGEALEEEAAILQATQRARRLGIPIHTMGLGTPNGERIPDIDPNTRRILGYKVDEYGRQVVSRLNEALLRRIAEESGGQYFAAEQAGSANGLLRTLRDLQRTSADERSRTERQDRTVWFLALGLLLLALDHVLARRAEARTAMKPMNVNVAARAALALLLLATVGWSVGALERGNRHYRAGRYAEAVQEYQAALREQADSPELHYNLGTALLQLGRFEEAQPHLQRALLAREEQLRQRVYFNTGYRTLVPGRRGGNNATQLLDAAIESYKHALRLDPSDGDAKWNLELALREKERQQQQSPQSPQNQPESQGAQDEQQSRARGGGAGSTPSQSSAGQGNEQGSRFEQRPMGQEQADRILSAIEQDERDLTREKLKKGQRRTPVARDW
ncbi:MAG: VWA domain-containing protein [Longimicrobiales bacterium]